MRAIRRELREAEERARAARLRSEVLRLNSQLAATNRLNSGCGAKGFDLNRKMLAEIAQNNPTAFERIVAQVK